MTRSCFAAACAAAALLVAEPRPAEADESVAHRFCAMQWASDRTRMAECVAAQIAGAQVVVRYLDWAKASPGPDGQHVVGVFELCSDLWTPDYAMVAACLRARALIAPPSGGG